jgi:hypothetical protein
MRFSIVLMLMLTGCGLKYGVGRIRNVRTDCGDGRVDVQNLSDKEARAVDLLHVQDATVEELSALPAPKWSEDAPRAELEKHTYRVSGVIVGYDYTSDGEIRVTLRGKSGASMIVSIVHPNCANNSRAVSQLDAVRAAWEETRAKLQPEAMSPETPVEATFTGVGFWNRKRDESGRAPNNVELHPVLKFEVHPPPPDEQSAPL